MGRYFGTDGFRGEANENLTADEAYKVGRFLGWYFGELKRRSGLTESAKVVIGKDTRRSSYMFEYALVAGLTASGADAYLLHVTTTPSVAYVTRVDGFDCGIMISASNSYPLLLAARERRRQMFKAVADTEHIYYLIQIFLVGLFAVEHDGQQDILIPRKLLNKVVGLEYETETPASENG